MSENQRLRRSRILSSAREIIEEHGYDGLTMKDLANRAGVAIKTLYDVYGSKEELLVKAIEERTTGPLEALGAGIKETGVKRLFVLAERECAHLLSSPVYAKSIAPILMARPGAFQTEAIYLRHHGGAIAQIADVGELEDWARIDLLVRLLLMRGHATLQYWANGRIPTERFEDFIKLNICQVLAPVTLGTTREIIGEQERDIHRRLTDWDLD